MLGFVFLNENNGPTENAKESSLGKYWSLRPELREKTVIIFPVESMFQANDVQPTIWAEKVLV